MWTSALAQFRRLGPMTGLHLSHPSYSVLSALKLKCIEGTSPSWHLSSKKLSTNKFIHSKSISEESKTSISLNVPVETSTSEQNTVADKQTTDDTHLSFASDMTASDTGQADDLSEPSVVPPRRSGSPNVPAHPRGGGAPVRTQGLAPFVAASADLRRLLSLGVDVSGWDRRPGIAEMVLRLDWQRDMAPRVQFLHDAGVPADKLAAFITRNPLIFKEDLDDLQVRVNYLEAKRFSRQQIASVISREPFWLLFSTARIDRRLGLFSGLFGLSAPELRQLATKCPGLITSNLQHVKDSVFTIKEEFGFEPAELKQILLGKPKVLMLSRWALQDRLQYLHNEMKLTHQMIAESPNVLTYRSWRVRQRHLMLNVLQRDQYDRTRPGYVSLDRLVGTTDQEFCRDVAQVPVASYNEFLKTL